MAKKNIKNSILVNTKILMKFFVMGILLCFLCFFCIACSDYNDNTKPPIDSCTVTYIATEGGEIAGANIQNVQVGGMCSEIVAVAKENYVFIGWSDGLESASRCDNGVCESFTVTAKFEKKSYNILYQTNFGGKILGLTEQCVRWGESSSIVEAVATKGYVFDGWSDGYEYATRKDLAVSDYTYIAYFKMLYEFGEGEADDPYIINSYQELKNMRYYPSSYFLLNCDLDLANILHEPLFTSAEPFVGTFDGGGHEICNMKLENYCDNLSLFGMVAGNIRNLRIINFAINIPDFNTEHSALSVGALASITTGIVENVYAQGKICGIELTHDGIAIGGLIGQAYGVLKECEVDIHIRMQRISRSGNMLYPFHVGGLVAIAQANIKNCVSQGCIDMQQVHDQVRVGGLISYYIQNSVSPDDIYLIKNSMSDVEINGDTSFYSGGFIAELVTIKGCTIITNCETKGNIVMNQKGYVGGFVCNIIGYQSEILLIENLVNIQDVNARNAGGFLYSTVMDAGQLALVKNYSECNIQAYMAAGFAFVMGEGATIYRCYFSGVVDGFLAVGFIEQIRNGVIEECFSMGTLNADFIGAGFSMALDGGNILNCYSRCNLNLRNADANDSHRNLVGGFAVLTRNAKISQSFYSGKISGIVYTPKDPPFYSPPIVSAFIGIVKNTEIVNCYVLYHQDSFAVGILGDLLEVEEYGIQVLFSEQEMIGLSQTLNGLSLKDIWVEGKDGYPIFGFLQK